LAGLKGQRAALVDDSLSGCEEPQDFARHRKLSSSKKKSSQTTPFASCKRDRVSQDFFKAARLYAKIFQDSTTPSHYNDDNRHRHGSG
jgi:hypothetical protein